MQTFIYRGRFEIGSEPWQDVSNVVRVVMVIQATWESNIPSDGHLIPQMGHPNSQKVWRLPLVIY